MNPYETVTVGSSLSCMIAEAFTKEEVALLAAVFTQLGDSLTTILVSGEFNKNQAGG